MATMCFTGRRPKDLFGYDKDAYLPLVEAIKSCVHQHILDGYDRFIFGGAQGFDQLAFWATHRLKLAGYNIKTVIYVPFRGQDATWRNTGLFSKQEYNLMLKLADEVHVLSEIDRNDKRAIVTAMHTRNHAMVNDSDAVFGLYPNSDWQLPTVKGGTAECLKYAQSAGKPIYQLSNTTLTGCWL